MYLEASAHLHGGQRESEAVVKQRTSPECKCCLRNANETARYEQRKHKGTSTVDWQPNMTQT